MGDHQTKYFNFPIHLLKGFLENSKDCLNDILYYAIFVHSLEMNHGTKLDRLIAAAEYFDTPLRDYKYGLNHGSDLYSKVPIRSPMVGISLDIFLNYYHNEKDEFEKVCLLAHLALRSILGNKAYCKVTNQFWFSRMAGSTMKIPPEKLPGSLRKYFKEYWTRKVKQELELTWGLRQYAGRGFYISYTMELENLIFQIEKKRRSRKILIQQEERKAAYERAMARLEF